MNKIISALLIASFAIAAQAQEPKSTDAELAALKAQVTALEAQVKKSKRETQIAKLLLRKKRAQEKLAVTDPEGVK